MQILSLINDNLDDKSGISLFTQIKNNCPFLKMINLYNNYFSNKTFSSQKVKNAFKTCFPFTKTTPSLIASCALLLVLKYPIIG